MLLILRKNIELEMTDDLYVYCARASGVARFTHNQLVAENNRIYKETGKSLNVNAYKKEFNTIKEEKYPWMYECPKDANQQVFADYKTARKEAFAKFKQTGELHLPDFHKKGITEESFYISNDRCKIEIGSNRLKLPKFDRIVKMKERFFPRQYDLNEPKNKHREHREYRGFKLLNLVIIQHSGIRYVSVCYQCEIKDPDLSKKKDQPLIALDMNVNKYPTASTNGKIDPNQMNTHAFTAAKHAKKADSAFSRADSPHILKQKQSEKKKPYKIKIDRITQILEENKKISKRNEERKKNIDYLFSELEKEIQFKGRERTRKLMRSAHRRVVNIVDDFYKKLALKIVSENQAVCIEDLDLVAMRQNHHVAAKFLCTSFGKLRKWIEHLAPIHGCQILYADQYFPSSKLCSTCHKVNHELGMEKIWTCTCGAVHDRDENAAKNLLWYLIHFLINNCSEATEWSSSAASRGDNDQIKWANVQLYVKNCILNTERYGTFLHI